MHKLKIFSSITKISLIVGVVALVLSVTNVSSLTGAFLYSALTAFGNPLGGGDWTPPSEPLFWVEEDMNEVQLNWLVSSSGDATAYKVYRSTDDVSYSLIASPGNVTSYTDSTVSTNTDYYYKVTAVDAAANETPEAGITGKYAGTKDIVIDDDSHAGDVNANGTVSVGGTGTWDKYATTNANGSNAVPSVLQNAAGGDNRSTANPTTGQTFTWLANGTLDGQYDIYVQYICDPSRTIARYDVFAGVTKLNTSAVEIYQSRVNGLVATAPCPGQAGTSVSGPRWVKLGNFGFNNQAASVTLTAQAGEVNILADAVGFTRTGDYVADPAPVVKIENPAEGASISGTLQIYGTVTDTNPSEYTLTAERVGGPAVSGFPGTVSSTLSFTNQLLYTWDTTGVVDGQYIIKLSARDALGNQDPDPITSDPESATDSVDWITVNVDNTAPLSFITVANSPAKLIENRISNGSFESGLTNWNVSGDVNLITGADGLFTLPQNGSNMIRVGRTTNEGNPARINTITQQIPAGVRTLGFYYNMFTYDYAGFDDPGFMVFVNDKMVFQRWASEIDQDDPLGGEQNLDSSGWQYLGLDLSKYPDGTTLTLAFYAGNDTLNMPASGVPHQTWVYLDNFSTNEAVVNAASQFEIHTTPGATAHYRIGSNPTIFTGNLFTLSSQPSNQTVYYWASEGAQTEATNSFHVLYDNVAPETITTLIGEHVENNLFKLNWLSPHDDNRFTAPFSRPTNAAGYEIKYSTATISASTDWNSLSPVTIVTEDGLPYGGYRAPRPENEQEEYFVRVPDSVTEYYFAVKSYDAATNTSAISNIAQVSLSTPGVVNNDSDIALNEYLPNPSGADDASKPAGEWVELYNKSSVDINVNGWAIYDADNTHELIISASNSDNDLDPTDAGETIVPAHGWLVVYRNGDADFDLANTGGDNVRLFNKVMTLSDSTLIDSTTYGVDATDDKAFARIPDGTGGWVDPVPTPGRANVADSGNLVPSAQLWNQASSSARFSLFDAINYSNAHYVLEYTYMNGTNEQQGGLTGDVAITGQQVDKNDLYFGTCSVVICTPHTGVIPSSIRLILTLTGVGIPDRTIIQQLTGNWVE